ncbi:hypothetical protein IGB42_01912 [Andreprevotia sp. IGB-42]|nr:hypothetical protein IGB42_01912 [Andreprevotia sp. IGB-42]
MPLPAQTDIHRVSICNYAGLRVRTMRQADAAPAVFAFTGGMLQWHAIRNAVGDAVLSC